MGIFGDASVLVIAGFIISIVAFLLQLIGFSTPYWQYASALGPKRNFGLWQTCTDGTCLKFTCDTDFDKACNNFKAAQAMATLAFILLMVAVVLVALQMFVMKDKEILKKAGAVCCIVGGALGLIGVIIFATIDGKFFKIQTDNLHFSFAFCVIAAIGGIASGVLLLVG